LSLTLVTFYSGEGSDGHTAVAKEGDDTLPEEGGDVDAGELVDGIVTFGQAMESSGGGFGSRNGRKAGLEKTRVLKQNLAQWVFWGF
jgi:hypothetical protein